MNQPTVCAVLLTLDRPELAAKAVECFRRQTYENKRLLIWDTGELNADFDTFGNGGDGLVSHIPAQAYREPQPTIGALRNEANAFWNAYPIIVHWDDDDWSHPSRIAEQVTLLQASGADVVGYNEMLFWKTPQMIIPASSHYDRLCEAWLYTSPVPKPTLGTSLCYWRKTWERKPFNPALPNNKESTGEDYEFIQGLKCEAVSALPSCRVEIPDPNDTKKTIWVTSQEPRMIARIHSSNTTKYNIEDARGDSWKRVVEWDSRIRKMLEAK